MAGHFIFARAWFGFSRSFPFERFNDLPDECIVQSLEEYCLNAYRLDLEVMGYIYKRRAHFIYDHVLERLKEECERGAIPEADPARLHRYAEKLFRGETIPWIEEKSLSSPEDLIPEAKGAWTSKCRVDGRPQNPSEGFKIACWAGWITPQQHAYRFGGWSPSDMLLLAEVPDAEIAAKAVEQLQEGKYLDELIRNVYFRFGHRPSAEISAARREHFRQTLEGQNSDRLNPLDRMVIDKIVPLAQRIVGLLLQDKSPTPTSDGGQNQGGDDINVFTRGVNLAIGILDAMPKPRGKDQSELAKALIVALRNPDKAQNTRSGDPTASQSRDIIKILDQRLPGIGRCFEIRDKGTKVTFRRKRLLELGEGTVSEWPVDSANPTNPITNPTSPT